MHHERLAWYVSLAGRVLSARVQARLSEYGLGHGEYRVLFALYDEEGLTQADIVARHHLNKSVVARVADRLETKGYVKRRPDPDDGRRKPLYLTAEAEALREEIRAVQTAVNAEATRGLDEEQVDELAAGLGTVAGNLGADLEGE